jgi:hypothetical protein
MVTKKKILIGVLGLTGLVVIVANLIHRAPPVTSSVNLIRFVTQAEVNRQSSAFVPLLSNNGGSPASSVEPEPVNTNCHDHGDGVCHNHNLDHADLTWPPSPRGTTETILLSNLAEEGRARQRYEPYFAKVVSAYVTDPRLAQALGRRFMRVTAIELESAGGPRAVKLVYYSYDNNVTVEVFVVNDNVVRVTTTPASEYQPEITSEETELAAEIARKYYTAQGNTRVIALQHFGILAYRPEGNGFYDTRVIYISFHLDSSSVPEFVAWVDLTSQKVMKAQGGK